MLSRILFALVLLSSVPAFADYDAGKHAYDAKDWAGAIAALRPAAEAGDDRALFLLGRMYLDGSGVVTNPIEAEGLYRKAAEKGNAEAMISLGGMFQAGIGVKQNAKTANAWFGRAAAIGNQAAAFLYAISLYQGDASKKTDFAADPAAAYKWLRIAAANSTYLNVKSAAEAALKPIANGLTSTELARLDKEAAAWKPADPATLGPLP